MFRQWNNEDPPDVEMRQNSGGNADVGASVSTSVMTGKEKPIWSQ